MGRITANYIIKWLTKDREPDGLSLSDFTRICYEVKPCDVLLIEGRNRISDMIKSVTQSAWSHAVLYVGKLHDINDHAIRSLLQSKYKCDWDTQLVIEGVLGKGIIISPISTYINDHIRICRPRGLSPDDAQKVIAYSIKKLGYSYDIRHVFDLGRFLLPWPILPRRLLSSLFTKDATEPTRSVCSSMIAEAFSSIDFPILPYVKEHAKNEFELIRRNPMLYTPRDFDYSPYFDIIKYPFIELNNYGAYHGLPWNRSGVQSDDGHNLYDPMHKKSKKKAAQ